MPGCSPNTWRLAEALRQNATSPETMACFEAIGAALRSPNDFTRGVARSLAAEAAPFANSLFPSVFDILTGDGDRQTRLWSLAVLASFPRTALTAEVVQCLPAWLAEKDPDVRGTARGSLGCWARRHAMAKSSRDCGG